MAEDNDFTFQSYDGRYNTAGRIRLERFWVGREGDKREEDVSRMEKFHRDKQDNDT